MPNHPSAGRGRVMTTDFIETDLFGDPIQPEPEPTLSAGRRLTIRQHDMVDHGIHPLNKLKIADGEARTCGECIYRIHWGAHGYPKCELGPVSHGPATDCRAWWPACPNFTPLDGS